MSAYIAKSLEFYTVGESNYSFFLTYGKDMKYCVVKVEMDGTKSTSDY